MFPILVQNPFYMLMVKEDAQKYLAQGPAPGAVLL